VSKRLSQRLEGAPFIAVQASYRSEATTRRRGAAHRNLGRAGRPFLNVTPAARSPARPDPPAETRSHLAVLQALAKAMGLKLDDKWQGELNKRVSMNAIVKP